MKLNGRFRLGSILFVGVFLLTSILASFGQQVNALESIYVNGRTIQNGVGIRSQSITFTAPGDSTVLFEETPQDVSGDFGVNVEPGTYDIHFIPPVGSGLNPVVYSNYILQANQNFVISYSPSDTSTRTLSGTMSDGQSNPISNLVVSVFTDDGVLKGSSLTDSMGHYSINLPAGLYTKIRFQASSANASSVNGYNLTDSDWGQNRQIGVNLTSGDVAQNFKLNLVKLNVIAKDSSGNPANGASVNYSYTNPGYTIVNSGGTSAPVSIDYTGVVLVNNNGDNFLDYVNSVSGSATLSSGGTYSVLIPQALTEFSPISFTTPNSSSTSFCVYFANSTRTCNYSAVTPRGDVTVVCQQGASQCVSTPSRPDGLNASSPTKVPVLYWSSVSGANSYNVYRDGINIGSTTATSFADNGTASGAYTYSITAVNAVAESVPSSTISVQVDKVKPSVSFTSPSSFFGPFSPGPIVSINASDANGLKAMVIHVYNSSNTLLSVCGSATATQLEVGSMSCSLTSLASGTYYIKAGANDLAGNNQTINSGNFVIN